MSTEVLLQDILDFIGAHGVVDPCYSKKVESLCQRIREELKRLEQEEDDGK